MLLVERSNGCGDRKSGKCNRSRNCGSSPRRRYTHDSCHKPNASDSSLGSMEVIPLRVFTAQLRAAVGSILNKCMSVICLVAGKCDGSNISYDTEGIECMSYLPPCRKF